MQRNVCASRVSGEPLMLPTFTVVMPAYNAASTIAEAIASVLAQTRDDFELLVVDDGSTDATAKVVTACTSDSRVCLLHAAHAGPAAARNLALPHARGRYVSMLDSDDLYLPGYLAAMGGALDADEDAALAYTDAWVLEGTSGRVQRASAMHYQRPPASLPLAHAAFLAALAERNFVFTAATVRRAVLDDVGGFDAGLRASEDYDLWLRIAARGHRAICVPGRLAIYRRRAQSLSSKEPTNTASTREVLTRLAQRSDVPAQVRAIASVHAGALAGRMTADGRALRATYRARLSAIALKRRLLAPFLWHRGIPAALAGVLRAPENGRAGAPGCLGEAPVQRPEGIGPATAHTLVWGGLWSIAGRVVPQIYALLISIAAARWLGADGMGRHNFIAFVEVSLIMLLTGGFSLALMRYVSEHVGGGETARVRGLVAWAWRVELGAAALGAAALLAIAAAGAEPRSAWALASVAAAAGMLHTIPTALLMGAQRWREATIAGVVTGALATAATAGVLASGGGITGMFAVEAAVSVVNLLWTQRLARRVLAQIAETTAPAGELRSQVLRYAALAFVNFALTFIVWRRSELFFLARYSTDAAIAIYSVAFAAITTLGMLFEATAAVVTPAVATLNGARETGVLRDGYRRAVRLVLFATLPATAAAIVFGPPLIRLLYGEALAAAGSILLIMLIAFPIVPVARMSGALLHGLGKQRTLLLSGIIAAVLNIALDLLLIPRFDAAGAAFANGSAQLVASVPVLFIASRAVGGLQIGVFTFGRLVAASALAGAAAWIIAAQFGDAAGVLLGLPVFIVAFGALQSLLRVVPPADARWLEDAIGAGFGPRGRWVCRALAPAPASSLSSERGPL